MFDLKEDIPNESILSVSSRILLVDLKFQKRNGVKVKLNIVVVLRDEKLLGFGDLRKHINFEVWTNPS